MAKAFRRHIHLGRSAAQTITNNTLTTVLFDVASLDTEGVFDANSDGLIMIQNSGFTHARFSAGISWDASATGDRWVQIQKAGADFTPGMAASFQDAPGMERCRLQLCTPLLLVSSGDLFTVEVWHNLGVNETIIAANNTYFGVELFALTDPTPADGGGGLATGDFGRFFPAGDRRFFPNANQFRLFPRR